jgi:hypothetical protein
MKNLRKTQRTAEEPKSDGQVYQCIYRLNRVRDNDRSRSIEHSVLISNLKQCHKAQNIV